MIHYIIISAMAVGGVALLLSIANDIRDIANFLKDKK